MGSPPGTWAGSRRDDCGPRVWRRCWHGRPPRGPGRARRVRRSGSCRRCVRSPACPTLPSATRRSRGARPGGTPSPRSRRGAPSSWAPRTCYGRRGRCACSRRAASRRARPRTRRTEPGRGGSREGGRRRSRRTPSRLPSGGRGTSARGGGGPSPAGTAATRPPSRRASDRPRSRRRAPSRAAPCQRARGSRRAPRRNTPPSRTSLPRSTSTSIAGRGRGRLGPGAPARDHGNEAAAGVPRGPRRPAGPGVAIARRRPPRRPPLSHEPADRRIGSGAGPPPRRVCRRPSSPHGAASAEPRGHAASTSGTQPVSGPIAGLSPSGASGGAGDRSPVLAYLAAVLRTGAGRAGGLGRSGPVGARSSDTLSYAEGHGRPSLPPPGGWSRVSVPPGGIVGHGRAPCAGAWPRQCEYRTETDERVARKLMRFLLSSY